MNWNKDITRYGWIVVAFVLAASGIHSMITMEIYGKVRISGAPPVLEGWPVFVLGLAELALGVYVLFRMFRRNS